MFRQYRPLERGEFFVVAGDTSSGGLDYSACIFLSKTRLDVPLIYHSNSTTAYMTDAIAPVLERISDFTGVQPIVAYETNNGGSFELERLAHLNKAGKFRMYMQKAGVGTIENPSSKKYGWTTSSATRPAMLQDLKEAIDNQLIRIYDKHLINEMFSFVINQTSTSWRAQAESGAHDDLIMALSIAWQMYQTEIPTQSGKGNYNKYVARNQTRDTDIGF